MSRSAVPKYRPRRIRRVGPGAARKVWTALTLSGYEKHTPWAQKEKRRRRAANKVAKLSRRANR